MDLSGNIGILDAAVPDYVCDQNNDDIRYSFEGSGRGIDNYQSTQGVFKMPDGYIDTVYNRAGPFTMKLESGAEASAMATADCYGCKMTYTNYWAVVTLNEAARVDPSS